MSNRQTRAMNDRVGQLRRKQERFVEILQALQAVNDEARRGVLENALLTELGLEVPVGDDSTEEKA